MNTEIKTYLNSLNYDELREYLKARKTVEMEEREREKRAADLAIAEAIRYVVEDTSKHIYNRLTDLTYAVSCHLETPISREKVLKVMNKYPTEAIVKRFCQRLYTVKATYYGTPEAIETKRRELGL